MISCLHTGLAAVVLALASCSSALFTPTYSYHGCISAPSTAFPYIIANAPAAGLSIAQCQTACYSLGRFAALGSQQCRCSSGNSFTAADGFAALDAGSCAQTCVEGEPARGICGGPAGSLAWSVYALQDAELHLDLRKRHGADDETCEETTTSVVAVTQSTALPETASLSHLFAGPTVSYVATSAIATATSTDAATPTGGAGVSLEEGSLLLALGVGVLAIGVLV